MTDVEISVAPPTRWDAEVAEAPGATTFQTTAWARFAAGYLREEPRFIRVTDGGRPRAWLLVFARSSAHDLLLDLPLSATLAAIARRLRPTIRSLRGPLFSPDATPADVDVIVEVLGRLGVRFGPLDATVAIHGPGLPHAAFLDESARQGWCQAREATFVVDLDRSEDEIWRGLKPAARKDIHRAERLGVTVRLLRRRSELSAFWTLLRDARRRAGLATHGIRNLHAMWDSMTPGKDLDLIVAEHAGELVAGLGIWSFARVAIEFAAAQSDRAVRERLYASDLVKWFALRHARSTGASYFDLAGIEVEPRSAKGAGIRQFKEKWGGILVEAPLVRIPARAK